MSQRHYIKKESTVPIMKTSSRKTDKKTDRELTKDDLVPKKKEEKLKKSVYTVSTPRSFLQKSSTADIYARKNDPQGIKAPKKNPSKRNSEVSPMKDLLKSSSSSISQISTKSFKTNRTPVKEAKAASVRTEKTKSASSSKHLNKKVPFTNVTVSSPIAKRKLNLEDLNENDTKEVKLKYEAKQIGKPRERTNTRTLDEAEIKVLTCEAVDNNAEMLKLTKKLNAQPKSFFVGLDEEKKNKEKSSDEEVSYEDDFESYESDFDSYHSEPGSDRFDSDNIDDGPDTNMCDKNLINEESNGMINKEESKLDSGNFELPDRSKTKPMDFIDEGPESDKKVSLTDEGFQDMSSGLSSMKTLHVDVLDRPLFIDFTKSKANKKKRKIFERLKQRAADILSMVTLHEMSYNLFEMKPIPYDLYMATFGRFNYTQTAAQTFQDGVTEEVQTEEVLCHNKWTQHPIEFSNADIYLNKYKPEKNEILSHFTFEDDENQNEININDTYIRNPLRIFFEQKDGAGSDTVLPYQKYKDKLKKDNYNVNRLRKFIKRVESKISNILSINAGNTDMSNFVKNTKFPFSTGYMSISTKDLDKKYLILKNSEITGVVFSETKNNLIITIHKKFTNGVLNKKCALCLWDLSIARNDPIKLLLATDNVMIGKYRGNTDGFFVGALEDGSINLWDLSEEASWCNDINTLEESSDKIAKKSSKLSQVEMDREWNLEHSNNYEQQQQYILQVSAFTSSAINVCDNVIVDSIVGLEFSDYTGLDGSHIVAQVCSLQRIGVLTIWSIIHEKIKTSDIGKALWSKMKLEKIQTILLSEHLEINNLQIDNSNFNLNAAKKRLALKKQERNILKRQNSRPKSRSKLENDRLNNVAISKTDRNFWENGIVCSDLKIVHLKVDNYLVGKNFGEVLCCRKYLGAVKVTRFSVANSSSAITCLQTSNLPYFLAATDCGTIKLCSLLDYRVLLTLDCRNTPPPTVNKYQPDHKGRFMGTSTVQLSEDSSDNERPITSLYWSRMNPLSIVCVGCRVCVWSLVKSDLRALFAERALCCVGSDRAMALLTPEGEVQVYKLTDDGHNYMELFQKYVSLL